MDWNREQLSGTPTRFEWPSRASAQAERSAQAGQRLHSPTTQVEHLEIVKLPSNEGLRQNGGNNETVTWRELEPTRQGRI